MSPRTLISRTPLHETKAFLYLPQSISRFQIYLVTIMRIRRFWITPQCSSRSWLFVVNLNEFHHWSSSRSLSLDVLKCVPISFRKQRGSTYFRLLINGKYIGNAHSRWTCTIIRREHVLSPCCSSFSNSPFAISSEMVQSTPNNYSSISYHTHSQPMTLLFTYSPIIFPSLKRKLIILIDKPVILLSHCFRYIRDAITDYLFQNHLHACDPFSDILCYPTITNVFT